MSTLSELLPSGGGGSTVDFVASGTLPNGKPVVLKSDGTVEVVADSRTADSIPAGSETVFNATTTYETSVSFDPNTANKFVIAYKDGGNLSYGHAIVGTVSGTSISFGSEYVFNSASTKFPSITFDPNTANKFVIAYKDAGNSGRGTAIVGTASGTTLSFGSEYVFNSAATTDTVTSFDPNTAGKFVVVYGDDGNSNYGTAIVGTVSGTSISFGSEVVFNGDIWGVSLSFDPNTANKFVVAYRDHSNLGQGTAIVGTVSGTSVSFGTEVIFNTGVSHQISVSFDPNTAGQCVLAYKDYGNSAYGTVIVGTVSGTSVSFGTTVVFNSGTSSYNSLSFDPNTIGEFVVAYKDDSNSSYGTAIVGTMAGTSISFGAEYVFNTGSTDYISTYFDPNTTGKFVIAYKDVGNFAYGAAVLGQLGVSNTNLTATNFVGITTEAIADTATGSITLQGGLSTNQTGLTIGSTYYAQGDGTISTVSTAPAINIGKALSATTLLLKDL